MKKLTALIRKISWKKGLAGAVMAAGVFCMATLTCFAAQGKIIAQTAKIRAQASTDSEVVGSTVKGKVIDILGAVKDGSGTVWYKVAVSNGGYGYIRSDLVETSDKITVTESSSSQPAANGGGGGSKPADTVPTAIGEQQATVKSNSNARIRSGASTKHDTVASLPSGTTITLIGEATDSSGNKWYQMTCNYNNKTVEGYVRSDLITLGAANEGGEAPAEGENPEGDPEGGEGENPEGGGENPEGGGEGEQPSEPPAEHNDYEIVYAQNDTGEFEYYLYDNINSNRQKLSDLLNVVNVANENNQKMQDQISKGKIIIIILAVVIVILFIVLTVLLFKLREFYYEDYDEEEEEEPEPEPAPVKKKAKKRVEEEEEEPAPVKKKKTAPPPQERPARSQEKAAPPKPKGEKELHAAEKKEPARKPVARKPQNFLVEDDEFEFEFLNMDDKDL